MTAQTIRQFRKMLVNLDNIMVKAEAHATAKNFEPNVLCSLALTPDMFPFRKQIQSACDSAKFAAAYLSEKTAPVHEDNETTWAELRERVKKVVNYLESFKDADFAKAETVKVSPKWAKGATIAGADYLQEISIPNFYFHLVTAYALLRGGGVDIGKMDYLGAVNLK